MTKVDMKATDYYKSGQHKKNVLAAKEKAAIAQQIKKHERVTAYNADPSKCAHCNKSLPYDKQHNKFCSKSCAAKFNNAARAESGWMQSEHQREVARLTLASNRTNNPPGIPNRKFTRVFLHECSVCHRTKWVKWCLRHAKTCGAADCKVQASVGERTYQNGSRKPVWYFNPFQNKEVLLDSSWEVIVADKLTELGVEWIRPSFIKWFDGSKDRRYFPDFYLPAFDLYLDPKNEYCMIQDQLKMAEVSKKINVVFGHVDKVINHITEITGRSSIGRVPVLEAGG